MQITFYGFKPCVICLLSVLAFVLLSGDCRHKQDGDERTPIRDGNELRSPLTHDMSPVYTENELKQLTGLINTFAFELYHKIADNADNLLFSPYSISVALAMTYAGARNETESQMASVLHFNFTQDKLHSLFNALALELAARERNEGNEDDKYLKLNIANAIWAQDGYPFLSGFLDTLAVNYDAGIWLVDFNADPEQARLTINDWIARQTEDKIQELLARGDIGEFTRLVLTNALYFNAAWAIPFNEEETHNGDFHLVDGGTITVPMMIPEEGSGETGEVYSTAAGPGYQAVELPYYGGEFSMLIVIPDRGTFTTFEQRLDYPLIEEIVNNLSEENITLLMPKFGYESQFNLSNSLVEMGMPDAFNSEKADFSGIDGGVGSLYIGAVIHKTFISVDEAGTEAAAATAVVVFGVGHFDPRKIIVNRPFIYMIRDIKTGAVLFLGRVKSPTA